MSNSTHIPGPPLSSWRERVVLASFALACVAGMASGAALKPEPPEPEPMVKNPRRVTIPVEPDAAALPFAVVPARPLVELRPDGSPAAPLFRAPKRPPKVARAAPPEAADSVFAKVREAMKKVAGALRSRAPGD